MVFYIFSIYIVVIVDVMLIVVMITEVFSSEVVIKSAIVCTVVYVTAEYIGNAVTVGVVKVAIAVTLFSGTDASTGSTRTAIVTNANFSFVGFVVALEGVVVRYFVAVVVSNNQPLAKVATGSAMTIIDIIAIYNGHEVVGVLFCGYVLAMVLLSIFSARVVGVRNSNELAVVVLVLVGTVVYLVVVGFFNGVILGQLVPATTTTTATSLATLGIGTSFVLAFVTARVVVCLLGGVRQRFATRTNLTCFVVVRRCLFLGYFVVLLAQLCFFVTVVTVGFA